MYYFQVMKALCYTTKLMSGLYAGTNSDLSQKLAIFSSKISGARATLRYLNNFGICVILIINDNHVSRLIDDIPLLKYSLEYGFGQKVCSTAN